MNTIIPIILAVALLSAWAPTCHANDFDMTLIADIAEWVKANGGAINEKIQVQHIEGSLSGLFAIEDLDEGEIVVEVPWNLILSPPSFHIDRCDDAEDIRQALAKDPEKQNPYEKYLSTRTKEHIPFFWSSEAKEILAELMTDFVTDGFDDDLSDRCDGRMEDEGFQRAHMLLQTRGEGQYGDMLVRFEDLLNHSNGHHINVQPEISEGNHVRVVANRSVSAGEQLQFSYNQLPLYVPNFANPRHPHYFQVTPQLFEDYGFVESLQQRWVIPEMRMVFDIIPSEEEDADEEDVKVDYIVPPSFQGLNHLRQRLDELRAFEENYGERSDIPEVELEGMFFLHKAMVAAYSLAIDHSEGHTSEKAWSLGAESWHLDKSYLDDEAVEPSRFVEL